MTEGFIRLNKHSITVKMNRLELYEYRLDIALSTIEELLEKGKIEKRELGKRLRRHFMNRMWKKLARMLIINGVMDKYRVLSDPMKAMKVYEELIELERGLKAVNAVHQISERYIIKEIIYYVYLISQLSKIINKKIVITFGELFTKRIWSMPTHPTSDQSQTYFARKTLNMLRNARIDVRRPTNVEKVIMFFDQHVLEVKDADDQLLLKYAFKPIEHMKGEFETIIATAEPGKFVDVKAFIEESKKLDDKLKKVEEMVEKRLDISVNYQGKRSPRYH